MIEEWRPFWDGTFAVSNLGRVRRNKPGPRNKPLLILKQQVSHNGYLRVCLRLGHGTRIVFVHRLVALAFIGELPDGKQVNHIDGDKKNNRDTNLEYLTPKENSVHASVCGLKPSGSRHYIVKDRSRAPRGETLNRGHLRSEDIIRIRELRDAGVRVAHIAAEFNITPSTVSKIWLRQTWSHI